MKKNKLNIVFEDKEMIVINKPAGLLTMATEKEVERTLFHQVISYEKKKNKNNKVFIVHRLDKDTSGLVMFAKNENLKHLFQENWNSLVKKRGYVGVVEGILDKKTGTIKSWINETKTLMCYSSDKPNDGKLAITKYKTVLENKSCSLLDIEIKTGRKNQIRVHMKDLNHPIVGDKKYGAKTNPIKRLGLHANILEIEHPLNHKVLYFETDVPASFVDMFKTNR